MAFTDHNAKDDVVARLEQRGEELRRKLAEADEHFPHSAARYKAIALDMIDLAMDAWAHNFDLQHEIERLDDIMKEYE